MRILLAGDLHYDMRQLDWVLAEADGFEVVVLVGDLLDISSAVALDAQVPVVLGYLERLAARGAQVVVCSGNHDLTGRDAAGEKAALWLPQVAAFGIHTDLTAVPLAGDLLTICPWWDGPVGRARVEQFLVEQQAVRAASGARRWVWAYHWPPPDLPVSWTGTRSYGDADLAGWIDRFAPDLVLTGHVHQAPLATGGSWVARTGRTWVVNAGRQIGPRPSHVIIDLDAWSASWWSFEATGEQALAIDGVDARAQ
jgi:Icc-related predicted phosphoesterase